MNFYSAFFYLLIGFIAGAVACLCFILFIMKEAMKKGEMKLKNKDGSWIGGDDH